MMTSLARTTNSDDSSLPVNGRGRAIRLPLERDSPQYGQSAPRGFPNREVGGRRVLRLSPVVSGLLCVGMFAIALAGCAEGSSRAARLKRSPLRDAKFASAILLPESLTLKEHVNGTAHAWGGRTGTEADLWVFRTEAPESELLSHFRQELPAARQEPHPIDADVPELVWRPAGTHEGEEVVVTVRKGEVQIRESLLPETAAAWRER